MSSSNSVEKDIKKKGLVRRCRSFKEDIISRIARNRAKEAFSPRGVTASPDAAGGWSTGSRVPADTTDPLQLVTHRVKEAYLTLQFVESLINKNCVDLLGGSSNVMLDLMGCLLSDIKKTSASQGESNSATSDIKSALGEFLTAVDALLLKERFDDVQKELYFQTVLHTVQSTRDALSRLQNLLERKESSAAGDGFLIPQNVPSTTKDNYGGTDCRKVGANPNSLTKIPNLAHTPGFLEASQSPLSSQSPDRKPPLPPKLKQWSAKSFDLDCSSKEAPRQVNHRRSELDALDSCNALSPHHQSLLCQWLEQSSSGQSNNNNYCSPVTPSPHTHHYRSHSHHSTRSNSKHGRQHPQKRPSTSSASKYELSSGVEEVGVVDGWTDSAVYTARSSSSSVSHSRLLIGCGSEVSLAKLDSHDPDGHYRRGGRTYSDSYQIASEESLDKLMDYDCRSGRSGATHNSTSPSLGSSLENLLLVDSNSQHSRLSPFSNASGGRASGSDFRAACNKNRVSVSSNLSNTNASLSGDPFEDSQGLASLSNYDPEGDQDGELDGDNVFISSEKLQRDPIYRNPFARNGTQSNSSYSANYDKTNFNYGDSEEAPPALPQKLNRRLFYQGIEQINANSTGDSFVLSRTSNIGRTEELRSPSPYENVDETDLAVWHDGDYAAGGRGHPQFKHKHFMSFSESRNTLVGGLMGSESDERPPIPPKKKHSLIAAYVEFLHNFDSSMSPHHMHFNNHLNQHLQHQHPHPPLLDEVGRSLTMQNPSLDISTRTTAYSNSTSYHQLSFTSSHSESCSADARTKELCSPIIDHSPSSPFSPTNIQGTGTGTAGRSSPVSHPPILPKKEIRAVERPSSIIPERDHVGSAFNSGSQSPLPNLCSPNKIETTEAPWPSEGVISAVDATTKLKSTPLKESPQGLDKDGAVVELYLMDAFSRLVPNDSVLANINAKNCATNGGSGKPSNSDGPEIKGGEPHLLIIYAASPDLKDVRFREVFLLTYRTFVRPADVVNFLWKRYEHFERKTDRPSLVHSRATLDLFVDVVASLTPMDLENDMVSKLRDWIYQLVLQGEIQSALKARKSLILKYSVRRKLLGSSKSVPASLPITTESQSLLDWSGTTIAQQMTLLDAQLFRQLEPAELLLWAREQSEDFCPALNHFTEHFNKVSYWARSKVLLCGSSRERNRTMKKLIEVMRKLREYNNFNSLLAVLAALDSAPIRRLGFSRRLTEALKPHATLTDSSGSFRTYRQALAESKPPCIPYIGLVLQDLTFVHIGNADLLPDEKVNWVKRWQQWVVLEPVRRFHACNYGFVRNDPLLGFLNNFEEFLNDDELWALSESMKARGGKS